MKVCVRVPSLGSLYASLSALSTAGLVMVFCWFAYAVVGMELFKAMTMRTNDRASDRSIGRSIVRSS